VKSILRSLLSRGKFTVLALVAALTLATASTALAGVGVGAVFNLGVVNSVNAITTLVGSVAGPSLRIDNNSTNALATALDLQVEPGKAPMRVNSSTKVTNLNADLLDGQDSSAFLPANRVRADGAVTDGFIDDFTSSAYTPVLSKTFVAPSSGFLHITGSISAEDDCSLAGSGRLAYRLRLDATPVTDSFFGFELDYEDCANIATEVFSDSGATSAVVPVSTGVHTIHLDAREQDSGSFIQGRSITAVFVPNGSGTVIPAAASVSGADAESANNPNKPK
jgi:hypothetical protein